MNKKFLILVTLTFSLGASACQISTVFPSISATEKVSQSLESSVSQELQASLAISVAEQGVPGAVLYLQTPDGVWIGAVGVSNIERNTPLKVTDPFRIASLTKMFVAVAVLQLVEANKLNLEDPLTALLPNRITQNFPQSNRITLRHLLNHTSGLSDYIEHEDYYSDVEETSSDYVWTAQDVIEYAYDLPAQFPPGESYYYSNTNYILLELIIENIAGQSLAQYLRDQIHTPLKLRNTWMDYQESRLPQEIRSYGDWDEDGQRDDVTDINDAFGLGDGGLISTVADLAKFTQALLVEKTLLKAETLEEMLTFVDDGDGGEYGLGIMAWENIGGKGLGHTGKTGGFLSTLWYLPEVGVIAIAFTNDEAQGEPDDIVSSALEIILNESDF